MSAANVTAKRERQEEVEEDEQGEEPEQLSMEGERVWAYVRENALRFARVREVDAARHGVFEKKAAEFVRTQELTASLLDRIDKGGRWIEMRKAIKRVFARVEGGSTETNAMCDLLCAFVHDHADEFDERPTDLTESELNELGKDGNQYQVAKALRLKMVRDDPTRLKLAQLAEKWILDEAYHNRLCVDLVVKQFMALQAMVDGGKTKRRAAESSFERHVDSAWILRDCRNGGLSDIERTDMYRALYKLAETVHSRNVDHFGPIVPDVPYVHKYVRPNGPADPVLVDSGLVDRIVRQAGIASREVAVGRYRCNGTQEPEWSEFTETVHLRVDSPALTELDKVIAAAKATRADWAAKAPHSPTSDYLAPL
jgi:hypothetical protein